ncbi:hypothetical protein B0A55_11985 [Friedmanniomyces simplex]|uniref:Uncharacterized protein n=1 Tax=Friedmanniomyces simplex TaxID=329884 RepID=A0A4U0X471_9PEZI|nr:hypothetical protein B0A55_11985 [Friedmanniomyces simplex]
MPLVYGEGKESARKRLMEAIRRDTSGNGDESPSPTISGSGELLAAPMRTAASSGDVQTVRRMLEAGVDVNTVAEDGGTALQIAAFRGQEAVVDLLLQWKADPNLSTPLMSAVSTGVSPKIAAKLIQAGAVATPEALWRAAARGDTAAAKTLLEAGVDVNAVVEDGGAAPSSWAALDRASDNLSSKTSEDEQRVERLLDELHEVRRQLVRNRKVQEQNNKKTAEKWDCIVREMEASDAPAPFEDIAVTDFGLQLEGVQSPLDFSGFLGSSGTGPEAVEST